MDKTYASALDYILKKAAEKRKGQVSHLSTHGYYTPVSSKGKTVIMEGLHRDMNIKLVIDDHSKDHYSIDRYEISELYETLQNGG